MAIILNFLKKNQKTVIFIIVFCELLIISLFLIYIFSKFNKVIVIMQGNSNIEFTESSNYKYFYEPKSAHTTKFQDYVGGEVENSINSDSLHERFDYKVEKDVGVFRIITLGDSETFGKFVHTKENYTENLEDKLNGSCTGQKYEVINLGVPGYDIEYAIERFEKRGLKYSPDIIIWMQNSADYLVENEKYIPIKNKIYEEVKRENESLGKDDYEKIALDSMSFLDKENSEDILNREEEALWKIKNLFDKTILIFSLDNDISGKALGVVEKFAEEESVTYRSFNIRSARENTFYPDDLHLNQKGHEELASALLEELKKENLINCNN